jgi:hypothetical protein
MGRPQRTDKKYRVTIFLNKRGSSLMKNKVISAIPGLLLFVMAAALGLRTGLAPQRQDPSGSWIKTKQRLTLLSANDGQAHLRLDAEGKIDKKASLRIP